MATLAGAPETLVVMSTFLGGVIQPTDTEVTIFDRDIPRPRPLYSLFFTGPPSNSSPLVYVDRAKIYFNASPGGPCWNSLGIDEYGPISPPGNATCIQPDGTVQDGLFSYLFDGIRSVVIGQPINPVFRAAATIVDPQHRRAYELVPSGPLLQILEYNLDTNEQRIKVQLSGFNFGLTIYPTASGALLLFGSSFFSIVR
jgi:hypothetical protein